AVFKTLEKSCSGRFSRCDDRFRLCFFFQLPASFSPSSQTLINRFDPFSTQFTFLNDGYFAAYNVRTSCAFYSVVSATRRAEVRDSLTHQYIEPFPIVRSKDRITIPCVFGSNIGPIKEADIALILSYRSFIFWDTKQAFRYKVAFSS